jgi:hypothetical protein
MVVEAYDPSSGAILGSRNSQGEVSSSAVGSSEFSRIGSAGELSADFLWRGDVYATTENATLKLDEHDEWRPFCPYRVIGASANGRFWVVLGSDGTAWRVTF